MPNHDEAGPVLGGGAEKAPMKIGFGPRARPIAAPVPSSEAKHATSGGKPARLSSSESTRQIPGAVAAKPDDVVEVSGIVTLLTNYGGFGVAEMLDAKGDVVRLTGELAGRVFKGVTYVVHGVPTVSRWGHEIAVRDFRLEVPANEGRLTAFVEAVVPGLPLGAAKKLIEHAKVGAEPAMRDLRERLARAPWSLDWEAAGVSRSVVHQEIDRERFLSHQLVGLCGQADEVAAAAVNLWGARSSWQLDGIWQAWRTNPYELVGHAPGYDFAQAETFSRRFGVGGDGVDEVRAVELVVHVMEMWSRVYGHVFLSAQELSEAVGRADGGLTESQVSRAIGAAVESGRIVAERGDQQGRFYLARHAQAEAELAQIVVGMAKGEPLLERTDDLASRIQDVAGAMTWGGAGATQGLDPMQLHAVYEILTSNKRLHVITGGPGSGKTAVLRVLVQLLQDKKVMLSALSGMVVKDLASKVEGSHVRVSTIYSLVAALSRKGEEGKMPADVLVVDEGTLPDLLTFHKLMKGLRDSAHMVILADPDLQWQSHKFVGQLPSIGAGRVVADLVRCSCVDRHRLMNPYRSRGAVLDVVEQLRRGVLDVRSRGNVAFKGDLPATAKSFAQLQKAYAEAVSKWGASEVVLLLGRRKGEPDVMGWNTVYANARLREAFNPKGEKVPCTGFRTGDRLVVTEPINALMDGEDGEVGIRLANGEAGTVAGYVHWANNQVAGARYLKLTLDDGRKVKIRNQDFRWLNFGWALTVHYTQGAQYKHVFMVVTPGSAEFVNANMLLTAFSRARESLEVYGDPALIGQIAQTPAPVRNSALVERVNWLLERPSCRVVDAEAEAGLPNGLSQKGG